MNDSARLMLAPGKLQARLALLFVLLAAGLIALLLSYWIYILEPRLQDDARVNAGALAQSQALNLADALLASAGKGKAQPLREALDEALILRDVHTDQPFILGIAVRADYSTLDVPAGSLDLHRGRTDCDACFVSEIPLYSPRSRELVGIATIHSSNAFFEQLKSDVRSRLLIGSGIGFLLLFLVWLAVAGLFRRVKASEEAADRATRAKGEFLATMSHEIRTPMNGVLGMVRLLQNTELSATQADYVRTIASSGEALLTILDDILDMSRIEAGKLRVDPAPFQLRTLLADIVRLMSSRAEEKGTELSQTVDSQLPDNLEGDENRIRQVLLNLVGNAIKFTEKGRVDLTVGKRTAPDGAVEIEFRVTDTGIGIPLDRQKDLFEPFTQSDSSITRRFGGSGLGLAISRRLVEAMGGTIDVKSQEGKGSTFFFRLPLQVAALELDQPHVADEPKTQRALRPLNILLTDDSPINRRVVIGLLSPEGHRIVEAENGLEALEALDAEQFDVVLMDLHMPEMDGLEAVRRIRRLVDPAKRHVPVIALTADILPEERQRCQEAGMNGFLVKPLNPEQLRSELAGLAYSSDDLVVS